jgi:flagellar protein FliO/FliZ
VAFDVGVKLVAVIALIYVLSAFSKRYLLRISPDAPGNLRVVEARPLGPKKTLYLVEIGGRMLVLGATESTINNLAEFSDPEVVAQLRSQPQEGAGLDFPRLLSAVRGSGIRASRSDFAASLVPSGFPASPARALKSEHTTVDSE